MNRETSARWRLLVVSAGLSAIYLGLTAWMRAQSIDGWGAWGATAFCGFSIVALFALAEPDRCWPWRRS